LKRLTDELAHGVTQRIGVQVTYLPELELGAMIQASRRWRGANWQEFGAAHLRVWRQRPWRVAEDAPAGNLPRSSLWPTKPGGLLAREFLQAGVIAAEVLGQMASAIAHLHSHFAHTATTVTWFAARLSARPFSFTAHAKGHPIGPI
jgi:hypothetical protein